jgi:poly-gamma-glutamate capsule biosynthesis protein CapA/YwtB (metallophosphatase superfamily)
LFGMIDTPFVDVAPALRIVTGTTWSNQRADDMLYLHAAADADRFRREGAVNILYPHWGYELEAWPRPEIVAAAQRFAAKYDAIVGHHAHNPQPVATIDGTPVAFGLGDFCFYYDLPTYRHGLVCRMDVTDAAQGGGTPRISALDWRQITSSHTGNDITVNLADKTLRWLR